MVLLKARESFHLGTVMFLKEHSLGDYRTEQGHGYTATTTLTRASLRMGKLMAMGCLLHQATETLRLVIVTKGSMLEMSPMGRVQSGVFVPSLELSS